MSNNVESNPRAERVRSMPFFRWLVHPRRLRIYLFVVVCLATLIGLFYVVENWRGKRTWTKLRGDLATAGTRIDLAAFVPPAVPDAENFTMTPALAPLLDFKPGTQELRNPEAAQKVRDFWTGLTRQFRFAGEWMQARDTDLRALAGRLDPGADTNSPAACAAAILKALEKCDPVIAELKEASRRPHCRFNLRYEEPMPFAIMLPHLGVVRSISQVLAVRASAELALGKGEAALQDLGLGLYLVDSVKTEPLLISHLVRCAVFAALAQPIWEGLAHGRWTPAQVEQLQARLDQLDLWGDLTLVLQAERAGGNVIIERLRADPALLVRLGGDPPKPSSPGTEPGEGDPWLAKFLTRRIPSGWLYQEQVRYNRIFQEITLSPQDIASRVMDPAAMEATARRLDQVLAGSPAQHLLAHRVLASILLPAVPRVYERAARAQASVDLARVACALVRYRQAKGQHPDSLGALAPAFLKRLPHDLIKGGPLQYRRAPDGSFVLYSIGWNWRDDDGRPGLTDQGKVDPKQGDWVWPGPAASPQKQPKPAEGPGGA